MNIYLGNLSLEDMQLRAGVTFPQELIDFMQPRQQPITAEVGPGQWHCYDLPFFLQCGDMETAQQIFGHLKSLSGDFKEPLQIGVKEAHHGN